MLLKFIASILLLGLSCNTFASDWQCTDASIQKNKNTYKVCGIGQNTTEDKARKNATKNAFEEFNLICIQSDDCKNKFKEINPLRTDCALFEKQYKCYRSFSIEVDPSKTASTKSPQHPCANLVAACRNAGYENKNLKSKHRLYKYCMKPLLAGKSVLKVTVERSDITACRVFNYSEAVNHPCENITQACHAAGFGEHKNKSDKNLMENCFTPILEGQYIQDVGVISADVEACRALMEQNN